MSLLRTKREEAGLTLAELAARAQMIPSKLSRIERSILQLKVDDVLILAPVLGCDPGELLPKLEVVLVRLLLKTSHGTFSHTHGDTSSRRLIVCWPLSN